MRIFVVVEDATGVVCSAWYDKDMAEADAIERSQTQHVRASATRRARHRQEVEVAMKVLRDEGLLTFARDVLGYDLVFACNVHEVELKGEVYADMSPLSRS